MLRQPYDIALGDDDRGIGTAVAGALQAIIVFAHCLGHGPLLTVQAINRTAEAGEQQETGQSPELKVGLSLPAEQPHSPITFT